MSRGNLNQRMVVLFASALGVLFSLYLLYAQVVQRVCPFQEGCPQIFGIPTSVIGLAFFLGIFYFWNHLTEKGKILTPERKKKIILVFAFLGAIMSGYYVAIHLYLFSCGLTSCQFTLGLPSSLYGTVLFVLLYYFADKAQV